MTTLVLEDVVPTEMADIYRKVGKAKSLLILDHPFFGTAVSKRPIKYVDTISTAAMSATGQIYMNPKFVAPLSVKQLMFLLAHEAMHYMFAHSLRRQHRNAQAWNVACDKVINDTLIDAKVGEFIDGGVTLDGARNNAAEELYDENDDGDGQGPGGIGNDIGDPTDENGQPLDESQVHTLEAQARIEAIQSAKAAKQAGKLPGSIERMVDEMINVKTPWHEILERYMQSKEKDGYTFSRPNRRFIASGTYLPGVDYVPRMGPLAIAFDTSGSIGQKDIDGFNAHINRILESCMPEKVYVLYCDTAIADVREYTPDDLPLKLEPKGGGGTSFRPVFDWLSDCNDDIEALIYFTDGYGDQSSIDAPALDTVWLTTACTDFPFGEVIKFEED